MRKHWLGTFGREDSYKENYPQIVAFWPEKNFQGKIYCELSLPLVVELIANSV